MKVHSSRLWLNLLSLAGCLCLASSARAAISGVNTPGTSFASITFNDSNSLDPLLTPGVTAGGPGVGPWNGATLSLAPTTDPVTLDYAQGDLDASFLGNTYAIGLNNVTLTQAPLNTGYAELLFQFSIEYQLDALGLPTQPTLFPLFQVNGTVQPAPGSFSYVRGQIDYFNNNTPVDTVTYNSIFNAPGNFSAIIGGAAVNGTTPVMAGNSTLTLNGTFWFTVDPASINVQTVPVPEPGTNLLLGLAAAGGLFCRWWRGRQVALT